MIKSLNHRVATLDVYVDEKDRIYLQMVDTETGNTVFYGIDATVADIQRQFEREEPQLTKHTQKRREALLKNVLPVILKNHYATAIELK